MNPELALAAHATELKYSRLRPGKTLRQMLFTKSVERLFSCLYDWTSDYGRSILRPILTIALLVPSFAVVFARLKTGAWPTPKGGLAEQDFANALAFSLSNVFPFMNIGSVRDSFFLTGEGATEQVNMEIVLVAVLQSVCSLTLLFLLGLAIRRRFQIS
jgi:hypothetical protein